MTAKAKSFRKVDKGIEKKLKVLTKSGVSALLYTYYYTSH
jgi:hypothetical protein